MSVKCIDCGLLDQKEEQFKCVRFDKVLSKDSINDEINCLYYKAQVYEEGEPLSPEHHLLMQNNENRSRKMRGPI